MKAEKKENLKNEKINPQAEELADLTVTDEQAQQAKGGGDTVIRVKRFYETVEPTS